MHRVMVDLETLSSSSNAVIVSIGAVYFSENGLGGTFYTAIKEDGQVLYGREKSLSTLEWWQQQSPEARKVLDDPNAEHMYAALKGFSAWLCSDAEIWGYGATFDNVVLANAYEAYGLKRPWSYRNDRCWRTLKALVPVEEPAREGTHHNALDDAVHQAAHAVKCLRALKGLT